MAKSKNPLIHIPTISRIRAMSVRREGERVLLLEGGKKIADLSAQEAYEVAGGIKAKLRLGKQISKATGRPFRVNIQRGKTVYCNVTSQWAKPISEGLETKACEAEAYTFHLAQKTQEIEIKVHRLFKPTTGRLNKDGSFSSMSIPVLDSRQHLERIG